MAIEQGTARAEFTVEPFVDANPGPHVLAALEAVRRRGFEPDPGPFASVFEGEAGEVLAAVTDLLDAARSAGATRVALQVDFAT